MTRPPPLPPVPSRRSKGNEEDSISRHFWTVTLICLSFVGLLLLGLLLYLIQAGSGNGGVQGAGSGALGEATGTDAGESGADGSGAKEAADESGSSNAPADIPPNDAGSEGTADLAGGTVENPAAPLGESDNNNDSSGLGTPAGATATADQTPNHGGGLSAPDGAASQARKNTISFAEPERTPDKAGPEGMEENAAEPAPKPKGPEIGLFSKPEASFFGVNVEAEKVAFVIDASSSMLGPSPEALRPKFERLKEELMRSVKSLSEKQLFTVVMFNDAPIVDTSFHRVKPTEKKIRDLDNILANTFPIGGTDPTGAMAIVLKEDYDVIFLLSDGEFDPLAIEWIRRQNSRHIVICTVCLGTEARTLQQIAKDSHGKYKAVR